MLMQKCEYTASLSYVRYCLKKNYICLTPLMKMNLFHLRPKLFHTEMVRNTILVISFVFLLCFFLGGGEGRVGTQAQVGPQLLI